MFVAGRLIKQVKKEGKREKKLPSFFIVVKTVSISLTTLQPMANWFHQLKRGGETNTNLSRKEASNSG